MIIDLSNPPIGKIDSAYTYVSLSRVKKLTDVLILRSFNKKILEPKISEDLLIENKRISNLDLKTYNLFISK